MKHIFHYNIIYPFVIKKVSVNMFNEIPKVKYFFPRSINICHNKTFLYGPPQSGKTTLALWHARQFQHVFYIDCNMLFSKSLIEQAKHVLSNVCKQLELLIIDNITLELIEHFRNIEIKCHYIYIGCIESCPKDFNPLLVLPLSFEEYIGIDKKNLSIEALLSNFIKDGNSPEMLLLPDYKKREYKLRSMQFSLKDNMPIFIHILALQSLKTSIYGIYTHLKQYIKISKDRIYPLIHSWQINNIVHICQHIDIDSTIKTKKYKLYCYDFALAADFADSKHFIRIYENMVFLELISMGFTLQYSDYCDFIDSSKKMIFICMPFASIESISKRIQLIRKKEKQYNSYTIHIITMSINHEFSQNEIAIDFANLSPHLRPI